MFKPYFKDTDGPSPLSVTCERTVRLEEVDALGIVWHGRYPSFLEDGREVIGQRFGLSYVEFQEAGVFLPIRNLTVDYLVPLKYLDRFIVTASLHWHEAARLNIDYKIVGPNGILTTRASTIQMMVDLNGELLLETPPFYRDFLVKWRKGNL